MEQHQSREFLEAPAFKDELAGVVSTPLTAENIDTYADDALTELVGLVQKTTTEYAARPTIAFATQRDMEEAAFGYFGLQNVELILDHIARKSDELHDLDTFISEIEQRSEVFLPPDEVEPPESSETHEVSDTRILSRLKTLLFILTNQYDIDLLDHTDIIVSQGTVDPSMRRSESYYSVQLPSLERHVLINDEIGNATYIFNTKLLSKHTKPVTVTNRTKSQLNNLLLSDPQIGRRVIYSEDYVVNLMTALDNPTTPDKAAQTPQNLSRELPTFLLPNEAPEGWLTTSSMLRKFNVSISPIRTILETYAEEIGPTASFRASGMKGVVPYFSEDQQAFIEQLLQEKGLMNGRAPEEYMNQKGLAAELHVNQDQIRNAIAALGDQLGRIEIYKLATKGAPRPFLSPAQIEQVRAYLEERGALSRLPEGYKFMRDYADELGLSHETVEKAMEEASGIGEIESYWSWVRMAVSLSPAQQQKVYEHLVAKGFFAQAPEGYLPQAEFTKILGVDHRKLKDILAQKDLEVGEVRYFKYGNQRLRCYSPEQQAAIIAFIAERKLGVYRMPEGYRAAKPLADEIGMSLQSVANAIDAIREELGEIGMYVGRTTKVEGFSPAQQTLIKNRLYETTGYGKPPLPEDYVTFYQFASTLGMRVSRFESMLQDSPLQMSFKEFRSKSGRKVGGVSPEQQATIRAYVRSKA